MQHQGVKPFYLGQESESSKSKYDNYSVLRVLAPRVAVLTQNVSVHIVEISISLGEVDFNHY